jgi:tetratricopeptide (TPR) repeat protein/tRNA A-37 threonylcarbamoyl transferase component Bud32
MADNLARLKAALTDRYAVEREVGVGGMATVYLAHDLKHRRQVAIKVLKPDIAAALGAERFLREIQIAASLQHPHVLPLYDSGVADGLLYYVMPYADGESLSALMVREGGLPVNRAVRILRDVADALQYAHSRGVVHRDIKPDNVMISGNHAVVADFGVAKAVHEAADGSTATTAGMAVGTPAYMAPEQATGEENIDHRADIYALGVVAYEILAGRPPFAGATAQRVIAAHVTETPEPVTRYRDNLPPALATLVMRCLAKHPGDRVQRMEELLDQLEALARASGSRAAARGPAHVVGLYGTASIVVLGLAYGLMLLLGLPDWVLRGAEALLIVGLPVMLVTAHLERRRLATAAVPKQARSGVRSFFTWRRAIVGGLVAFGVLSVVVVGHTAMRTLGIGPIGTLLATGVLEERDRLILTDFVDRSGDTTRAWAVTEALRVDLGQSPSLTLVTKSQLAEAFQRMEREVPGTMTVELAREVAEREGIKAVVSGEISVVGGSFVLFAQLVVASSGDVLVPVRETARDSTEIVDAVDRLSNQLRERIGESLRSIRQSPQLARVSTASLPALRKYSQATRAIEAGAIGRGVSLYREAIAIDSGFAEAYRGLAVTLGNYGIDRALQAQSMSKAYEFRDRLPERERLWTVGSYHMGRNEYQAALVPYLTLLELSPNDARLLNNVGVVYHEMREEARSLEYYERARDQNPTNPNANFNVVVTNIDLGNLEQAKLENERFAERIGNHLTLQVNRAIIGAAEFDYDALADAVAKLAEFEDESTAALMTTFRMSLAGVRGQLRAGEQALLSARERAERGQQIPEYLRAVIGVGLYDALVRGNRDAGIARVESALESFRLDSLEPFDRPYLELAEFYARAGDAVRGRKYLEEFDRDVPAEFRPLVDVEYDRAAAQVVLAEGRLADAIDMFQRADRRSCRICVLPGLARIYDEQGKLDSLQAVLERYVLTPEDDRLWIDPVELAGVYRRLAALYEARGNVAGALDYYGRFVDLWKDADPELQPLVAEARESIERLSRERR